MNKLLISIIICFVLIVPLVGKAQQTSSVSSLQTLVEELQARVKTLQEQVVSLQAQLKTAKEEVAKVRAELKITRSLQRGATGDEVKQLQEFLKNFSNIYPEGLVTGYFGPLTERAVQRWQEKQGIVNSGDPMTTGYGQVGPRTIAKINEIIAEGAGQSDIVPPGLLTASGIQKIDITTTAPLVVSTTTPSAPTVTSTQSVATSTIATSTTQTATTTVIYYPPVYNGGSGSGTQSDPTTTTATTTIATSTATTTIATLTQSVATSTIATSTTQTATTTTTATTTSATSTTTVSVDTNAPSAPTNLTALAVSPSKISLSWSASTDNVGVAGYRVTEAGGPAFVVYTVTSTSFEDSIPPSMSSAAYTYWVVAYDVAGNESPSKSVIVLSMASPDIFPPVITPLRVDVAYSFPMASWTALPVWLTDENSTTQVEFGLTSSYGIITTLDSSGAFLRTVHSVALASAYGYNLTSNTTYHYRMISKDAYNNTAVSGDYTFTTTAPPSSSNFTNSNLASVLESLSLILKEIQQAIVR